MPPRELNIEEVRRQTPACEELVHFNNAGCSLSPIPVNEEVSKYLVREQEIGGYETEFQYKMDLEGFYSSAARLVRCDPGEIAFCDGNTRGWQQFFYSLGLKAGDRIITSRADYGSNIVAYIQLAKTRGVQIDFIKTDRNGDLDMDSLVSLINDKSKLISISHVPTGCGIVNDAETVGAIASEAEIPFLLDASQSAGHLDLDVKKIGCTALTTTGRKYLRGPRGTGFMFVAGSFLQRIEPFYLEQQGAKLVDENSYELLDSSRRFENYECNMAGKLGLKVAMDYAYDIGTGKIESRIIKLAKDCRRKLGDIPYVTVHDTGIKQCGIVTFSIAGRHPQETRKLLWEDKINIWVSTGPGSLIDFQARGLDAVSRASLHYYNTKTEIDRFCNSVAKLASKPAA